MLRPCSEKARKTCRSQKDKAEHGNIYYNKKRHQDRRLGDFLGLLQNPVLFWKVARLLKALEAPKSTKGAFEHLKFFAMRIYVLAAP